MTSLDRKLVRDLLGMWGQALAISLVIACGVAIFVLSLCTLRSLEETQQAYYARCRFADVFAHLKRAPNSLAARVAELPGVAHVQTRLVVDVTLDVDRFPEPASGRLISVPERRTPGLNDIYLRSGRYIEPGQSGEVLASEAFVEAHGLGSGSTVTAIINGRKQRLTIVGVALTPEYVYEIRPADMFPDPKRFGIFWMGYQHLAAAYDMQGAFNDLALTLRPDASEPEVLRRLDRLIEPYGGLGSYGRHDQVSHRYLSDEIKQLRANVIIVPAIFLGVAAFLLNVVLSRLIGTQREQIAALKAFGYSHWEVGLHYLKFVLVLVAVGSVLGTAVGAWLGRLMTAMYTQFYHFPVLSFRFDADVVALALLVSGAAAVLGTLSAVRRAVVLEPAVALRPEPPASYRPALLERLGLQRLFNQATRMVLRNLERQPFKAGFSVAAIALAVAILVVGTFTEDALHYMMDYQFEMCERYDMSVALVEPASARALHEMTHLPGVQYGEAFRSVAVRLKSGHRSRRLGLMGMQGGGRLNRLIDRDLAEIPLPAEGLLLSDKLAELLHVGVGDALLVEVLEGERPTRTVPVAGLVQDYTGTSAYMEMRALNRLLHEGPTISGAFLTVDPRYEEALYHTLKATPRVAGVVVKRASERSFWETVAQNLLTVRIFNMVFAGIIAFGVVYNNARIALSERSRELATLRVIGFTRAEISAILLGELAVLTAVAVPAGLALGYGLSAVVVLAFDTDLYRIPLVIAPATYGFAAAVVLAATLASALTVRRKLDHLDLVAVLKTKE
jgi:putative ABC transport system permease protein